MPFAPQGWGGPPKSSNWRQQGAPRVCRDWGGALTFRGMRAGCGRLDVQGGEPTFWKLPGPPHLLGHPALTRPRHAAFPEPRANVSLLQPRLPIDPVEGKQGGGMKSFREGALLAREPKVGGRPPPGSRELTPTSDPGGGLGLRVPRPRGRLPHPRLGPFVAFLLCTLPVLPQAAACSLELFTSLISFFRSALRLLRDTARWPGI